MLWATKCFFLQMTRTDVCCCVYVCFVGEGFKKKTDGMVYIVKGEQGCPFLTLPPPNGQKMSKSDFSERKKNAQTHFVSAQKGEFFFFGYAFG